MSQVYRSTNLNESQRISTKLRKHPRFSRELSGPSGQCAANECAFGPADGRQKSGVWLAKARGWLAETQEKGLDLRRILRLCLDLCRIPRLDLCRIPRLDLCRMSRLCPDFCGIPRLCLDLRRILRLCLDLRRILRLCLDLCRNQRICQDFCRNQRICQDFCKIQRIGTRGRTALRFSQKF